MKVFKYIKKIVASGFFGKIVITFDQGKIVHIEEKKSVDPKLFK